MSKEPDWLEQEFVYSVSCVVAVLLTIGIVYVFSNWL